MRPGTRNPPHKATVDIKSDRHKAIITGVRMGTGGVPHDVMSNGIRSKEDEGRRRDSEDTRDETESDESDEELEVYSKDSGELNPDNTYFNLNLVTLFHEIPVL
jgi:hypothetical protein